jgi:hypothetical protein
MSSLKSAKIQWLLAKLGDHDKLYHADREQDKGIPDSCSIQYSINNHATRVRYHTYLDESTWIVEWCSNDGVAMVVIPFVYDDNESAADKIITAVMNHPDNRDF